MRRHSVLGSRGLSTLPASHERLKLYLICYGVYRFVTEYIRPEPASYGGLTYYQWVAMLLIGGLSIHWLIDARLKRRRLTGLTGFTG